ncbi:uncharacterized protein LOC117177161 isoform X2 [Belonocnema kinseyi]|uniref:uncharacterized protein LOC117177161 isoform X2 n=1 Tax=Belonocnema kinseyi TaxID=2817044 RepID=UPI00143DC07F|nr:uncharacterized protein LOC117177161 isoform X2 [Belonocnema kinseyi]
MQISLLVVIAVFLMADSAVPKLKNSGVNFERLRLDQDSGLDGKVRSVRFNSGVEKDLEPDDLIPGIRAFGIPRNKLEAEPESDFKFLFESRFAEDVEEPGLGDPRSKPAIEAYKPKISGHIERVSRSKRSIKKNSINEFDDLWAEEAKVFRPLFVYRQKVQKRVKNQHRQKHQMEPVSKSKYPKKTIPYYRHNFYHGY